MKIEECMAKDVAVCHAGSTLHEAASLMSEHDCGALPVVSEEEGARRVVGMITDRDICLSAFRQDLALKEIPVEDAMSRDVLACAPDDDHSTAQRIMREARVRRIPVVEDGKLSGIISLAQIARAAADEKASEVSQKEVGRTLAVICEPMRESSAALRAR